jgi:hypothetical protein
MTPHNPSTPLKTGKPEEEIKEALIRQLKWQLQNKLPEWTEAEYYGLAVNLIHSIEKQLAQAKREGVEEVIEKIIKQEFMEYLGDVPTQYLSSESIASIESHDKFVDKLSEFLSHLKEEGK